MLPDLVLQACAERDGLNVHVSGHVDHVRVLPGFGNTQPRQALRLIKDAY